MFVSCVCTVYAICVEWPVLFITLCSKLGADIETKFEYHRVDAVAFSSQGAQSKGGTSQLNEVFENNTQP